MENDSIHRICNYASCKLNQLQLLLGSFNKIFSAGFQLYSNRCYQHMKTTMDKLKAHCPSLKRTYDDSFGVYPCWSFNLGKQTACCPHTDHLNLAQGWCSISPVGSFDPKEGGHIILWNLKLVADFPAGATVLIPSALITHSNTAVKPYETRYSIVQYAAGGLFRWVENGFMSDIDWQQRASENDIKQRKEERENRWRQASSMFMKLSEFHSTTES